MCKDWACCRAHTGFEQTDRSLLQGGDMVWEVTREALACVGTSVRVRVKVWVTGCCGASCSPLKCRTAGNMR